jgi:hypothetical protein
MCLEVTIRKSPSAKAGVGAEQLSQISGLQIQKARNEFGACLHVSASGGQCSCDLLARKADLGLDTWMLDPARLDGLAKALALLGAQKTGFEFRARWLGEVPGEPLRIKLAALLEMVRNNKVPRNAAYVVGNMS